MTETDAIFELMLEVAEEQFDTDYHNLNAEQKVYVAQRVTEILSEEYAEEWYWDKNGVSRL